MDSVLQVQLLHKLAWTVILINLLEERAVVIVSNAGLGTIVKDNQYWSNVLQDITALRGQ